MSMRTVNLMLGSLVTAACGAGDPRHGERSAGGASSQIYDASRYFSDLTIDMDGTVHSLGDGELWRIPVDSDPSASCLRSVAVRFRTLWYEDDGHVYFQAPFADGSVSTLPVAPYDERVVPLWMRRWDHLEYATLSGGTVRYEVPAEGQHSLIIEETQLCEAPRGYSLGIDPSTCAPVSTARLDFTGLMGEEPGRIEQGEAGWTGPDGQPLCVVPDLW